MRKNDSNRVIRMRIDMFMTGRVTAFPLPDISAPEMQRRRSNPKFVIPLKLGIVGHKQHARPTVLRNYLLCYATRGL
jgi:hypothetical protein